MSNKNFGQFAPASSINMTDHIVGYTNTSPDGERRWTLETLMKAINNVPYARLVERSGAFSSIQTLADISGATPGYYAPTTIVMPPPTTSGRNGVQLVQRSLRFAIEHNTMGITLEGLNTFTGTRPAYTDIKFSQAGTYEINLVIPQLIVQSSDAETVVDFVFEKTNGTQLITAPSFIVLPVGGGGGGSAQSSGTLTGRVSLAANDKCRVRFRSNQGGGTGKEAISVAFPEDGPNGTTIFQLDIWKVG